jgi:general L-amino acid transport system substrate-binding protein
MNKFLFVGALTAATLVTGLASAATLDDVKARGTLKCGVSEGAVGFASVDANGTWSGFEVAFCKAIAAATLGDASKVTYVPTTNETRFTALASGEIDVLTRNSTWTFSRDADLKLTFTGVHFYGGQGFLVKKDLRVTSAAGLDGASICVPSGTTTELNLADYFKVHGMTYTPVNVKSDAEGTQQFLAGTCDVYTNDISGLAAMRSSFETPADYALLPEVISKEPLGLVVRQGDDQWADIVAWTKNALIAAEEYGITSANIEELSKGTTTPEINRILGTEGNLGEMLGLDPLWAKLAIAASGNYGEIFEANLGATIALERGQNAQWSQGGLLIAQPFR